MPWAGGDVADGMTVANTLLNYERKKKKNGAAQTGRNVAFVF